ncbi:MAG: hypothetical protein ACRDNL_05295 [Spirillospora sp.]
MSRVRLLCEGRVPTDREDGERLAGLLTVFFGFGIFTTNAAMRLGHLTQREFGYAMACYAWLRRETDPAWAAHLDPGPLAYLRRGLACLANDSASRELPARGPRSVPIPARIAPEICRPRLSFPYPRFSRGGRPPGFPGQRRW